MNKKILPSASACTPVILLIVGLLAIIQSISAYWRFLLEAISALIITLLRDYVARRVIDLMLALFELIRFSVFVVIVFSHHRFEGLTITVARFLLVQSHPDA